MSLTIEDLVEKTGYSKPTIYNICADLGIKAKKGVIPGNIGKGLYSDQALDELLIYKELIESGYSKESAYVEILSRRP